MKFLEAKDRSLSQILVDNRFRIDAFQREYRWQRKHIEALISDLATNFDKYYKEEDTIESYRDYGSYYMGPIVLCDDSKELSIVDGQQRLTSFTLLLIYLSHLQIKILDENSRLDLEKYLFVKTGGKKTLVLNVESRIQVIDHLIRHHDEDYYEIEELENIDTKKLKDESIPNIIQRYEDITKLFPEDLKNSEKLEIFIEWLLKNVVLVEIKAFSMESAYTIFETMNDRGMSLNPTEILKGFLLSMIEDDDKSEEMNKFWKERIFDIKAIIGIDSDLDFFKNWLRAKYAETKRANIKGAENEDFEQIGSQFHSWVKNNSNRLYLKKSGDFYYFIRSDFDFFSTQYLKIFSYKNHNNYYFENLYINNFYTIADSLSYPLFLSPISKSDDDITIDGKIKIIGKFIDIYTNIRLLQNRTITQSTIRNYFYELIKDVRNLEIDSLHNILNNKIEELKINNIPSLTKFHLMNNWGYYHYYFARIIYHFTRDNDEDFQILLRSRKQRSYILVSIFDEKDFHEFNQDPFYYPRLYSVANHVLIHRNNHLEFIKLSTSEKIQFLFNNFYLPELNNINSIDPFEFLEHREDTLQEITDEIWNFRYL
ncbi:DUF262 domain-containing protein [Flavobacterium sp. 3-218]